MSATRCLVLTFDSEDDAEAFDIASLNVRTGDLPAGVRYPLPGDAIGDDGIDILLGVEYLVARVVNAWSGMVLRRTKRDPASHPEIAPGNGLAVRPMFIPFVDGEVIT